MTEMSLVANAQSARLADSGGFERLCGALGAPAAGGRASIKARLAADGEILIGEGASLLPEHAGALSALSEFCVFEIAREGKSERFDAELSLTLQGKLMAPKGF